MSSTRHDDSMRGLIDDNRSSERRGDNFLLRKTKRKSQGMVLKSPSAELYQN